MSQHATNVDIKEPYILALDIGTSSVRALLFDATGVPIPDMLSQHTYKLTISSDGEVSVDADGLVEVIVAMLDDILHLIGEKAHKIAAVALDTFWHSLVGIDGSGRALTPVITWEDTRAQSAAHELRTQLNEKEVHNRNGVRFHASYWPAKLRWLAVQQSDIFKQVVEWISFGEYLHRKLLGRSICSLSMASATGMLTRETLQWDQALMSVLGVRPEQFPALGDAHEAIKGLLPEYARRWPSLNAIPWFPAIGDGASACIGSGCTTHAHWSLTMGTSSAIRVVLKPQPMDIPLSLWLYRIDGKRAVLGGALSEGGNLLNWLDNTLKLPPLEEAEKLVIGKEPGSHGLTILPFLSGERSMGWHAEARLTISGISRDTTPVDLLQAGIESLAYQLFALHEQLRSLLKLEQYQLVASGGVLMKSEAVRSIISDTLGLPIYPSRDQEASARGVALLALEALGLIPDLTQIEPVLQFPTQPDFTRNKLHRNAAERQAKLYRSLLPE